MQSQAQSARPYVLNRDEGRAIWTLGTLTLVKTDGAQTAGAFGLIEQLLPPGLETPYHVHRAEDEAFYVLEGELTFIFGDRRVEAGPGAYVFGPRGVPHGYRVGSAPTRMLVLSAPAGFVEFATACGEPAPEPVPPPPAPPDMAKLLEVAARYQIEILGPLPE